MQNWVEAGGKKAQARMDTDFLDWALADFSGYVAADELYDGPFCILSAVDNRRYKRLLYDVLDHYPTHEDIRTFLGRLKMALTARALTLVGITTDGSALYPVPLAELFRGVPHQVCTFHVLADVVKAVLVLWPAHGSVWPPSNPNCPEGVHARRKKGSSPPKKTAHTAASRLVHPSASVRAASSEPQRAEAVVADHPGPPQLPLLRELMLQVYALFDRRCRTQTALDKLAQLRRRRLHFPLLAETLKKLFAPTLEKALTFLDDKLLPSTSNAVERGNRRYRKMQKQVYRVRAQAQICARLALDMWREAQAEGRQQTLAALHLARAG